MISGHGHMLILVCSCICPGKPLVCCRNHEGLSACSAICCETGHKFAGVLEPSMVPSTLRAGHGSHLQGQSEPLRHGSLSLAWKIVGAGKHAHVCMPELHTKAQLDPCPPWGAGALGAAPHSHHTLGTVCTCPGKLQICPETPESLPTSSGRHVGEVHQLAGIFGALHGALNSEGCTCHTCKHILNPRAMEASAWHDKI